MFTDVCIKRPRIHTFPVQKRGFSEQNSLYKTSTIKYKEQKQGAFFYKHLTSIYYFYDKIKTKAYIL